MTLVASTWAQTATTGILRGQVADPSGAVVANATVVVLQADGTTHSATTNRSGNYEIGSLPPGKYTVTVNAPGFSAFIQDDVTVATGTVAFDIALEISVEKEKVNRCAIVPGKDKRSRPNDGS